MRTIDAGAKPRLLAILDEFEGWERGADWNDLDFLFSHSQEIARIAIVVDPRWEVPALAFAGAGVRRAPVKLFPPNELAQARKWLAQSPRCARSESTAPAILPCDPYGIEVVMAVSVVAGNCVELERMITAQG